MPTAVGPSGLARWRKESAATAILCGLNGSVEIVNELGVRRRGGSPNSFDLAVAVLVNLLLWVPRI
jgi:hypothetical protein